MTSITKTIMTQTMIPARKRRRTMKSRLRSMAITKPLQRVRVWETLRSDTQTNWIQVKQKHNYECQWLTSGSSTRTVCSPQRFSWPPDEPPWPQWRSCGDRLDLISLPFVPLSYVALNTCHWQTWTTNIWFHWWTHETPSRRFLASTIFPLPSSNWVLFPTVITPPFWPRAGKHLRVTASKDKRLEEEASSQLSTVFFSFSAFTSLVSWSCWRSRDLRHSLCFWRHLWH